MMWLGFYDLQVGADDEIVKVRCAPGVKDAERLSKRMSGLLAALLEVDQADLDADIVRAAAVFLVQPIHQDADYGLAMIPKGELLRAAENSDTLSQ